MTQPTSSTHKSGYVAVMGRPNAGKSTLVNTLLGQKIAAVSPRPQTTRRRQLGILTLPEAQIIFVDTPGVHQPRHKLGESMVREAHEALQDCDLLLFLVDGSEPPTAEDQTLAGWVTGLQHPPFTLLLFNKIDLLLPATIPARLSEFAALLPTAAPMPISAARGDNCPQLLAEMIARLPEGPEFYPEEQITDLYEREIAADLIREAALLHLRDEVPHGIAVRIDDYSERDEQSAHIAATLFVERETHKGIVIGKGGAMLKKIGTTARQQIEAMNARSVYLELRVKVQKNWRDDDSALWNLGFAKSTKE